jgi:putative methyltransferase (TIGR04325 family)
LRVLRKKRAHRIVDGYASWDEAAAASSPYRTDFGIYHQICSEIMTGRSSGRNLMPLLAAFALFNRPVDVLDFGGNLGMIYFEMNRILPDRIASWTIADLPEVKSYGDKNLAGGKLRFICDSSAERPDAVIASGVLQYLENPYQALNDLAALKPKVILLHELPLSEKMSDYGVQILGHVLGGGSRPFQFLTKTGIEGALSEYEMLAEIKLPDWVPRKVPKTEEVARLYIASA